MTAPGGGELIKTTSASASTGTIALSASPYDSKTQAVPASLDGKLVGWLIEHASIQGQWELVRGVYTHSGRTVTRPTANVLLGTEGAGANTDFAAGGLVVSVVGLYAEMRELRNPPEDTITGALTVDQNYIGQLITYTGNGHTWTINAADASGVIGIVNAGTGDIAIAAGTATISGVVRILAGLSGTILYHQGGVSAVVLGTDNLIESGTDETITIVLTAADFNNRQLKRLTLTDNQFIRLPADVPKDHFMYVGHDVTGAGEKVYDPSDLSNLYAYNFVSPKIAGPGVVNQLLSLGNGDMMIVGAVDAATVSPRNEAGIGADALGVGSDSLGA